MRSVPQGSSSGAVEVRKDPSAHWITANRLFLFLTFTTFAGIVLPLATIGLKLSAGNFHLWEEILTNHPALNAMAVGYPLLDLRQWPILARLSWHHPSDGGVFRLYLRLAAFNALSLVLVLFGRRQLKKVLQQVVHWLHQPHEAYARRVIFVIAIGLVATYQTRSSLGFWWPGIGGWTYENWETSLVPDDSLAQNTQPPPDFLQHAVVQENAAYLPSGGILEGPAMMLHFADGKVLPGNYGLSGTVYPIYVFGKDYLEVKRASSFFRIVQTSLDMQRRGHAFLLPAAVALSSHLLHMKIDYSSYPPSDQLERISFWRVRARIDNNRRVTVVGAVQTAVVEKPIEPIQ